MRYTLQCATRAASCSIIIRLMPLQHLSPLTIVYTSDFSLEIELQKVCVFLSLTAPASPPWWKWKHIKNGYLSFKHCSLFRKQTDIHTDRMIWISKQSTSPSWQCNISWNHHQPAMYEDKCMKCHVFYWRYESFIHDGHKECPICLMYFSYLTSWVNLLWADFVILMFHFSSNDYYPEISNFLQFHKSR